MSTPTTEAAPRYVGVPAAAERIAVHPDTIRALIHRGVLPALRAGRHFRINLADLDRLSAIVTVTAAAGPGDGGWAVAIGDGAFAGSDAESRAVAEAALSAVPDGGGIATVDGSGTLRVPHRAAGRAAAVALAGLATVPGGDTVTFTVAAAEHH